MNIKKLPLNVLLGLQKRGFSEFVIEKMSAQAVFEEYCSYNGLPMWGRILWTTAFAIKEAENA